MSKNSQKTDQNSEGEVTMGNNLTTTKSPSIDGFDTYEDGVEGVEQRQSAGPIQGALLKFTNQSEWVTRDGQVLSANLELVAIDVARILQRWGRDHQPLQTIYLEPGQKFPNLSEWNEGIPSEEWIDGPDGKKRGPWQAQHIVYLLDPLTISKYSFATGTIGGAICVRDLVDKTQWMRRFRGTAVVPVVTLSDAHMHTRYGGRQRPTFLIKRWITFGGGDALPNTAERPTLPGPATPTAAQSPTTEPAEKPSSTARAQFGAKTVTPPTLKEEIQDEIPWIE